MQQLSFCCLGFFPTPLLRYINSSSHTVLLYIHDRRTTPILTPLYSFPFTYHIHSSLTYYLFYKTQATYLFALNAVKINLNYIFYKKISSNLAARNKE